MPAPARIAGLDGPGRPIAAGEPANLVLVDPTATVTVGLVVRSSRSRVSTRTHITAIRNAPAMAPEIVPTPPTSTPSRPAWAMTARTPDQAAIFAAASFDAMPPLPRSVPTPPAIASSVWSISTISSMSDASASKRGAAVRRPGWAVGSPGGL